MTELSALLQNEYKDISFNMEAAQVVSAYQKKQRKFYTIIISLVFCVIIGSALLNLNTGIITRFVNSTGEFLSNCFSTNQVKNYEKKPTNPTQKSDDSVLPSKIVKPSKAEKTSESKQSAVTDATQSGIFSSPIASDPSETVTDNSSSPIKDSHTSDKDSTSSVQDSTSSVQDSSASDESKTAETDTEEETVPASDFVYIISDGAVIITDYNGSKNDVIIPSKIENMPVKAIDSKAFSGKSIESIKIPDSVETIGSSAFKNCGSLKTVKLSEKLKTIAASAFYKCTALQSVALPSSLRSIGSSAFGYCSELESIAVPKGVQMIDKQTFFKCRKLSSVTLPEMLKSIKEEAFYGCSALKVITVPSGTVKLGDMCLGYIEKSSGSGTKKYNYDAKNKDFTIRCYIGSAAYTYAVNNGFTVINLGGVDFPTSIYLNKYIVELKVGSTYDISYSVDNPKGDTTFMSDDTSVAKVSSNGKVTAVKAGTARITVKNNGVSRTLVVIVE